MTVEAGEGARNAKPTTFAVIPITSDLVVAQICYSRPHKNIAHQLLDNSYKSAFTGSQRP